MIKIYLLYTWEGVINFGTLGTSKDQAKEFFKVALNESEELFSKKYWIKEVQFLISECLAKPL